MILLIIFLLMFPMVNIVFSIMDRDKATAERALLLIAVELIVITDIYFGIYYFV